MNSKQKKRLLLYLDDIDAGIYPTGRAKHDYDRLCDLWYDADADRRAYIDAAQGCEYDYSPSDADPGL